VGHSYGSVKFDFNDNIGNIIVHESQKMILSGARDLVIILANWIKMVF